MDTSDMFSTQQSMYGESNGQGESFMNFNFKTIFLILILICACCLLSFGYNFEINNLFNSGASLSACFILFCFMFYVFYELFKKESCDELNKKGSERLSSAFGRGLMSMGKGMNYTSQKITSPTLNRMSNYANTTGQRYLPP